MRPAERDLIMRIPKVRGYRNKPKTDTVKVFSLDMLSKKLKPYAKAGVPLEVDVTLLKTAGLLGSKFKGQVKILADGEVTFPFTVKGIKISKSAQAKMEGKSVK